MMRKKLFMAELNAGIKIAFNFDKDNIAR